METAPPHAKPSGRGADVNNELRKVILDSLVEHVIYYEPGLKIVWANKAACESLAISESDLKGRRCHELWYGLDAPCEECPVLQAFDTGRYQEGMVTTRDGLSWLIQATPVPGADGVVSGVVEVALDISHFRNAEKVNMRAAALDDFINAMRDAVVVFNTRGVCIFANQAFEDMFGLRPSEFMGKNFMNIPGFELQDHEEIMKYTPLFREGLMEGRSGPIELHIKRRDGEMVHVSGMAGSVHDEVNRVTQLVITLHDITKRKQVEGQLLQSHRSLEIRAGATALTDAQGNITWVDPLFLRLWGLTNAGDALGSAMLDLWQLQGQAHEAAREAAQHGDWVGDLTARNPNGVNFRAAVTIAAVPNVDGLVWKIRRLS